MLPAATAISRYAATSRLLGSRQISIIEVDRDLSVTGRGFSRRRWCATAARAARAGAYVPTVNGERLELEGSSSLIAFRAQFRLVAGTEDRSISRCSFGQTLGPFGAHVQLKKIAQAPLQPGLQRLLLGSACFLMLHFVLQVRCYSHGITATTSVHSTAAVALISTMCNI